MSRRFAALVLAVGLSAGLVAGCGIPDHTEVEVEGAGQVSGAGDKPNPGIEPKSRLQATSVQEFVTNYLAAAAGEFDVAETTDRLKDYVTGAAVASVSLKAGVTVVKVNQISDGERNVKLSVTQLGVLNDEGQIVALPEGTPTEVTYDLTVLADESGSWHLTKVPPGLPLLDVEALKTYYSERPVYFWNNDRTALVPDLRWLPAAVGTSRVPTELLKMIEGGPSPMLAGAALPLPSGSKLLINAPYDNGQLTMNWSPDAVKDDDNRDLLAQQVAWTVPGVDKLILKINGQVTETYDPIDKLLTQTPYPIGPQTHAYAILDGKVRALGAPAGTPAADPLGGAADQNLRWAGFSRTDERLDAAVVTTTGANEGVLQVGTAAAGGAVTAVTPVSGGLRPTAPPVWLPRSKFGLVATDGGLYQFDASRRQRKIALTGLTGEINAVATAPDGQRIALVVNHRLYVVPVSVTESGVTLAKPRLLVGVLSDLTAVAWTTETTLSVGGTADNGKHSIVDVTVDGTRQTARIKDVRGEITMIAVYPESVVLGRDSTVLYQADNASWMARGGLSTELGRSSIVGETSTSSPPPDGASQPMSPFFVY